MTDQEPCDMDKWIKHAIDLAKCGDNRIGRNPYVGCVIISKDDKVIGSGYHSEWGGKHAEVLAIEDAREKGYDTADLQVSTLYVTLEPCSHFGKTPPCTDLILKEKIPNVVIGMEDPNGKVAGIEQLKAAGVNLTVLQESDIRYLNRAFIKSQTTGNPWVTAKIAASIDGNIALDNGESKWITNKESRHDVQLLRSNCGAIITGAGTILSDNPRFTVRDAKSRNPDLYVYQGQREIRSDSEIYKYNDRQVTIFTELPSVDHLIKISHQSNTNHILLECGPTLLASFMQLGLVDEFVVYIAPFLMGKGKNMVADIDLHKLTDRYEWYLYDTKVFDGDVRLRYINSNSTKHLDV